MSDSDRLDFVAYIKPPELTAQWFKDVLYQFWQYGLRFSLPAQNSLSWEEELTYQPERFPTSTRLEARAPLSQWCEEAAIAGSGSLYAYDKRFRLFLTLRPRVSRTSHNPDAPEPLGMIEVSYDRVFLNPEHSPTEDLLPLYQQTWFAHIHWAEVCCTFLEPLYALSYQQGDIIYESPALGNSPGGFPTDPLLNILEKVHQTLPILVPQLEQTRLQYFSPSLLTDEEERSLCRQPYLFSEYLPTGGLLVIPRAEPFHYGFGLAHNLYNQSREVIERANEEGTEDQIAVERASNQLLERGNALSEQYRRLLSPG